MKVPPERLGLFYLGSIYDYTEDEITGETVNYDARDLTTHAVCLGMTGSGKTGLCVCLLEEAAIDQVPAIIIDPKGDITNHLLHFPTLQAHDFSPWVNLDDARRKGMTREEYSEYIADIWSRGLKDWGITSDRIGLLRDSVDYTIYTPGSSAGVSVNILDSLRAPKSGFEDDPETIRDMIMGLVGALLNLASFKRDAVRNREGILLQTIFEYYWRENRDLTLGTLITNVQDPPFNKLGVFDLETYYPQDKRLELAMALNSLLASPNFKEWLEGEPLNIPNILYTEEGIPRHSIFSLAHLSEEERMFFVTLLLENLVTWIRNQPGTTSLRVILYFDEVFGFMPPVAEPPSKKPLLTLLKQARAFGLGVVLVTQNPVDIDYKGLTNTGTWFIGRLQTQRDKDRVLEGLRGAVTEAGGNADFDYDRLIGALKSRVFLLHNIHEDQPRVFHTRWAMNYLRGPLTRPQIAVLMKEKKRSLEKTPLTIEADLSRVREISEVEYSKTPPALDPEIGQIYLRIKDEINRSLKLSGNVRETRLEAPLLVYKPQMLAKYTLRFVNRKRGIDETTQRLVLAPEPDDLGGIDWSETEDVDMDGLSTNPLYRTEAVYEDVPEAFNTERKLKSHSRELSDYLYYNSNLPIKVHNGLNIYQRSEESVQEFIIRLKQAAREKRDAEIDKLEEKYEKQLDRLEDKIDRLSRDLSLDQADYEARKREEIIGLGETVLGFFMGRRRSTAATTAARRRRMTSRVKRDIEDSKEEITELEKDYKELESELKIQVEELKKKWSETVDEIEEYYVKPRRSDVDVERLIIAWIPHYRK